MKVGIELRTSWTRDVAPRWTESSGRHGVPQPDIAHAIAHSSYTRLLPGQSIDDGEVWLYIGHPHPQTDREVEVLVTVYGDGREARIFHAMELGPKFRAYRQENPDE